VSDSTDLRGFLSPVVRRLVDEHDLDPSELIGTGRSGRLTRRDVENHLGVAAVPVDSDAAVRPVIGRDERLPLNRIRRLTGDHMVRSLATSAHTLVVVDTDYSRVEAARSVHKASFKAATGAGLSYLPFVARAVVDAIGQFPQVNATVEGDDLVVHHYVNLGIAVDLDFAGLVVPVIADVDQLRLTALATRLNDRASRARAKRLNADDLAGGTFTITNPGGYGTLLTGPIINQPQVAILSTDGVRMRPVAVPDGDGAWAVAVHPVGNLALSFDHRAFDGAYASAFVAAVRHIIETRDWEDEL
jgi:pyruvate dehydrogenase E2 component (dihydrolipoamide acetyltransferase)